VAAEIHFRPFELNPTMPFEGQDLTEYLLQKYGGTAQQLAASLEGIRLRGEGLGFTFNMEKRARAYNTFDAHRLLHWAGLEDDQGIRQRALKHALFSAYFTDGRNPGAQETLLDAAVQAGLDRERAHDVIVSSAYAKEVREEEEHYVARGIRAVPAVIINDRHLIQGGQAPEAFEQALRQVVSAQEVRDN
jgi:predicted DsbA family dithiol-disulfide isomerase